MRARAVIGANFGDEGKGLVTDYLCSQGAGMVVRFNGGAQAGHTVVTPEGPRHVFGHFGAGTFLGVPTFLSQFFVCNPILFMEELGFLEHHGLKPKVYAHPNCLVTTFADMMINQKLEDQRGLGRHGSCGVGFNETINRSEIPELKITMSDLWNRAGIEDRLAKICDNYARWRCGEKVPNADIYIGAFIKRCEQFANLVHPLGIAQCVDPVFEGAQGLLLDQTNREFYPHLTRSNTGAKNVRLLCEQAGISKVDLYYVSRTYLTRHGAGPLPGEDHNLHYNDNTNLDNPYQGKLRFAPLDHTALLSRIINDARSTRAFLAWTHCDQKEPMEPEGDLWCYGPTRADVRDYGEYWKKRSAR